VLPGRAVVTDTAGNDAGIAEQRRDVREIRGSAAELFALRKRSQRSSPRPTTMDAEFERETWISQKQKIGEKNRSLDRPPEGPEKTERADVRAMALKENLQHEDDRHRRRYELGGRKSWLELRIFARLELFGEFEFALGVFGAAKFAVSLAEKVMRDVVVGVHGNRALAERDRQLRFSFFLQKLAEEKYGPVEVASSQMERCKSFSASSNF